MGSEDNAGKEEKIKKKTRKRATRKASDLRSSTDKAQQSTETLTKSPNSERKRKKSKEEKKSDDARSSRKEKKKSRRKTAQIEEENIKDKTRRKRNQKETVETPRSKAKRKKKSKSSRSKSGVGSTGSEPCLNKPIRKLDTSEKEFTPTLLKYQHPSFLQESDDLIDIDFVPSAADGKYGKIPSRSPENRSRAQTFFALSETPLESSPNTTPVRTSDDFDILRPRHKVGQQRSMKSSLQKIARKSMSHSSHATRTIIHHSPAPSPNIFSPQKRHVLPGESKSQKNRQKRTISLVPSQHSFDFPCEKLFPMDLEKLRPLKYPIYLDFSSPVFRLRSVIFLQDIPNIVKEIDLSDNQLEEFTNGGNLSNLKRLSLENNQISSINFKGLSSLKVLSLKNNRISDISVFSDLRGLVNLNLSGNPLNGDFQSLIELQNLQLLDLSNCSIELSEEEFKKTLLSVLTRLQHLTHLVLSDNPFFTPNLNSLTLNSLPKLLYFNHRETELQRKLDSASRAEVKPKSNREMRRLEVESKLSNTTAKGSVIDAYSDLSRILEEFVFPDNVLHLIFQYLSQPDKLNASLVSKKWRSVCVDILCSSQEQKLDCLDVLVGTRDSNIEVLLKELNTQLPNTFLRVNTIYYFDEEILVRNKALLVILNEIDDEFSDVWSEIYNQLSYVFSRNLVSQSNKPSPLFPFVDYAMYIIDECRVAHGVDHLFESIGCKKILPTQTTNFSSWTKELVTQLHALYPNTTA